MPRSNFQIHFEMVASTGGMFPKLDKAVQKTKKVTKATKASGKAAKQAAGGLRALAGAYNAIVVARHAAGAMSSLIKPAITVDHAMRHMEATTNLAGNALEHLKTKSMEAAGVTPFNPAEAIDGAAKLRLAMLNTDAAGKALIPTLSLAHTFLNRDIKKSVGLVSQIIGGFNLNVYKAADALDYMTAMQRATGVRVDEMSEGMKKLGLVSAAAGRSGMEGFQHIMPMFALATRGFRSASSASTGLLRGMLRMGRPDTQKALASLGVVAHDGEKIRPLPGIMLDLASAAEKNANNWPAFTRAIDKAFGGRAGKPFISIMQQLRAGITDTTGATLKYTDAVKYLYKEGGASMGLLSKITDTYMQSTENQLHLLGDAWFKFRANLGQYLGYMAGAMVTVARLTMELVNALFRIPIVGGLLKTFASAIVGLVGAIAMVISAALIWKGGLIALRLAFAFLIPTEVIFTQGVIWSARAMSLATIVTNGYWASLWKLKTMMYKVVWASKAMWTALALGGKIGLIIGGIVAVAAALAYIFRSELFGAGAAGAKLMSSDMKRTSEARAGFATRMMEQLRAVGQLQASAELLRAASDNWFKSFKDKAPMLNTKAQSTLDKVLQAGIKSGAIKNVGLVRQQQALVNKAFTARGNLPEGELKAAQNAWNMLSQAAALTAPTTKNLSKALKSGASALEDFQKNSHLTAAAGHMFGIASKDYNKALEHSVEVAGAAAKRLHRAYADVVIDINVAKGRIRQARLGLRRSVDIGSGMSTDLKLGWQARLNQQLMDARRDLAAAKQRRGPARVRHLSGVGKSERATGLLQASWSQGAFYQALGAGVEGASEMYQGLVSAGDGAAGGGPTALKPGESHLSQHLAGTAANTKQANSYLGRMDRNLQTMQQRMPEAGTMPAWYNEKPAWAKEAP
jgi:hypothetical protein